MSCCPCWVTADKDSFSKQGGDLPVEGAVTLRCTPGLLTSGARGKIMRKLVEGKQKRSGIPTANLSDKVCKNSWSYSCESKLKTAEEIHSTEKHTLHKAISAHS
jgi:hypothetical protein